MFCCVSFQNLSPASDAALSVSISAALRFPVTVHALRETTLSLNHGKRDLKTIGTT